MFSPSDMSHWQCDPLEPLCKNSRFLTFAFFQQKPSRLVIIQFTQKPNQVHKVNLTRCCSIEVLLHKCRILILPKWIHLFPWTFPQGLNHITIIEPVSWTNICRQGTRWKNSLGFLRGQWHKLWRTSRAAKHRPTTMHPKHWQHVSYMLQRIECMLGASVHLECFQAILHHFEIVLTEP